MDSERFDRLVRSFGQTRSRRQTLRGPAGAAAAGALALSGREASADAWKRAGKACKKNPQCCSHNCSGGVCSPCPPGTVNVNGSCAVACSEVGGVGCQAAVGIACGCTRQSVCIDSGALATGSCDQPGGCPSGSACDGTFVCSPLCAVPSA